MILKGQRQPSSRTMADMRKLRPQSDLTPGETVPPVSPAGKLNQQLDFLRENAPVKYESAKQVINALAESARGDVNLKAAAVAIASQPEASAAAEKIYPSVPPKPVVDEPTVHKLKPKRDADLNSLKTPGSAKQPEE
jgi:hypothetical protein